MTTALILAEPEAICIALETDLKMIGVHVLGATTCANLVQDAVRSMPDVVVVRVAAPGPELFIACSALESVYPVAVAVFTDDVRAEAIERALASGIHAWIVRGYGTERLRPTMQLARARFRKDCEQRRAFREMAVRLEERKLVDRAKGILMTGGGMAEEEAFRTLRDTAMQGKQRLGQVAQRLIDAARSAEAINRAGQLRMLSQRMVKLHLLALGNVDPASARALQRASIDRVAQNLATLGQWISGATFGDLLEAVEVSWRELETALSPGAPDVQSLDDAAEGLLEAAERLTTALEAASPVQRMHIVNLAGRQRMLAQRVAKFALLRGIARDAASRIRIEPAQEAAETAFREANDALRRSAFSAETERAALDRATEVWDALCRNAANPERALAPMELAQTSEELLELFDSLTERYEHSLKVLVA